MVLRKLFMGVTAGARVFNRRDAEIYWIPSWWLTAFWEAANAEAHETAGISTRSHQTFGTERGRQLMRQYVSSYVLSNEAIGTRRLQTLACTTFSIK